MLVFTRVEDASKKSGFSIKGDVKFDEVAPKCSYITPVPGGVGLMTIAGFTMNTYNTYQKRTNPWMTTINQTISLPVMESFYTLQGEGFTRGKLPISSGLVDVMLDMYGAMWEKLGCFQTSEVYHWRNCWKSKSRNSSVADSGLLETCNQPPATPIIVITGGEPYMHNLDALTNALHEAGFQVNIETSGSHPISGHCDWICLSPKNLKHHCLK